MVCMGVTEVAFPIDDIDVGIMWEAWKVENRVGETPRVVWARGIEWDWEGSDEKSGFGDWYCKGREDNCEGPCNEIKSSQSWLPESFWLGTEERGVGNGWEMDLAGCTGVDPGDNAPGRVTFLAGTGGGGGEVLRLNGAGSVGVDFGRVVTALEYGRAGETNLEGLQFMNHLNSYLARMNFSISLSRSASIILVGGGWRASSGLYMAFDLIFPLCFMTSTCSLVHASRVMLFTFVIWVPSLRWMLAQLTLHHIKMPKL